MKEPIENWKGERETADGVHVGTFQNQTKQTIQFYGKAHKMYIYFIRIK